LCPLWLGLSIADHVGQQLAQLQAGSSHGAQTCEAPARGDPRATGAGMRRSEGGGRGSFSGNIAALSAQLEAGRVIEAIEVADLELSGHHFAGQSQGFAAG